MAKPIFPLVYSTAPTQILNGLIRLAAIHETAAAKDDSLVAKYDSYIEVNIKAFIGSLTDATAATGQLTYDWRYSLTCVDFVLRPSSLTRVKC